MIEQLLKGIERGREEYARITSDLPSDPIPAGDISELALSDNVDYMKGLLERGMDGRFQAIYIDPPFFTRSKFNAAVSIRDGSGKASKVRHLAFDDRFERSLECYIENMTVRILLMMDLLTDSGLIWIHLDWHSSHYVRIVLDELLGEKNFVNEIIWCYKSGGSGKKHFSRKHDTILVYSKTTGYNISIPEEKSYNRGFKAYNFKGVKEYRDDQGWYTLVNMKDVWMIDMVGRTSRERTGYATQKPLELMNRIIEASTEPGDTVGDFFCGSGSFLEAAGRSGRIWYGCDNERLAVSMSRKRLHSSGSEFRYITDDKRTYGEERVTAVITGEDATVGGRRLVTVAITEFVPDIDTGYIRMSDRGYVEKALREAPLGLIDYVVAEGCRGAEMIYEGFDNMKVIAEDNIRLSVVDVFGREYIIVVDCTGGGDNKDDR